MFIQKNSQRNHADDSKDTLVQMNIRVKKSVAQSFRSFCETRRLTQSEGLRLLLMGEDFPNRDLIMRVYQQEMTEKDDEIICLREQNKELLEFQRGKESWIQHQRKEWIKIAKTMLDYLTSQTTVRPFENGIKMRPHRFESRWGKRIFRSHRYPTEGGCYEVYILDLVRGLQNKKVTPDHSIPIFVCGQLEDGTLVKFRWYPKQDYIGIRPCEEGFGSGEEPWLLGCIISQDGAADLVCAVPHRFDQSLDPMIDIDDELDFYLNNVVQVCPSKDNKPGLDSIIAKASRKQTQ